MVNLDAGNAVQRAISEGRAKQCSATCKATGEQCRRAAREGYPTCSVHGAGTAIREASGERRPPGRPIEHGLYSKHLPESMKDTYDDAFGDLTLIHEAAVAKTIFAQFLRKMAARMEDDGCNVTSEDGEIDIELMAAAANSGGKRAKEDEYYFVRLLEAVTKTVTSAYDQLQAKKIIVNIEDGESGSLIDRVNDIVAQEMAFINGVLCPDCRRRVSDALDERTQTVVEV